MHDASRILIFDTTLRDGEQALMQSLSVNQKLQIALALEQLGVDIIEAGFPVSSQGDFESVATIARTLKTSIPCGLSRAILKDIDVCAESLRSASHFRIHTFIATSDVHVRDKLRKPFEEIMQMGIDAIRHARRYTDDVEFSCEDAGRTPLDQLCRMVEAAIKAGAKTINIPDTVGYTLPNEFGGIIQTLMNKVPNIDQAVISVHCHNDLGMATANSLSAIQAGARQVECCMNGLGERAGNAALEEIVSAIRLRREFLGGLTTHIRHENIAKTSALVSTICSEPVPSHKPIVGSNAFSHSSGIHQDGVLKNRNTYEILTPESVGFYQNTLRMTARSGRHMIKDCLTKMGYADNTYDLNEIYSRFLALADRKGQVFDYDLEALLFYSKIDDEAEHAYTLDTLHVMTGNQSTIPTATVRVRAGKRHRTECSTGNGPVDAIYNAITRLTGVKVQLTSYNIRANGEGMDALGQVDVTILHEGRTFHGMGLSTDVLEASALALIHAINNVERAKTIHKSHKKTH